MCPLLLFHQKCALYDTGRPWLLQVVCSGVVDREVSVTNLAGHSMKLTRDEDGSVEVAGVKLFMRDKMTTNGVIHVIGEWDEYCVLVVSCDCVLCVMIDTSHCAEDVIIQPSVRSVIDHLQQSGATRLLGLIEKAELTQELRNMDHLTLFLPSEKAIIG